MKACMDRCSLQPYGESPSCSNRTQLLEKDAFHQPVPDILSSASIQQPVPSRSQS